MHWKKQTTDVEIICGSCPKGYPRQPPNTILGSYARLFYGIKDDPSEEGIPLCEACFEELF